MDIKITEKEELNEKDMQSWQELWGKSRHGHFFNSPCYLLSFLDAFDCDVRIVLCHSGKRLVGVLPLVKSRKFGLGAWVFPDRAKGFLDKGCLLLAKNDPAIFGEIVHQAGKNKNLFLKDLDQEIFRRAEKKNKNGFFEFETVCPRSVLCRDPLSKMKTKQKREMRRRLRKYGGDLKFEFFEKAQPWQLEEMKRIEAFSHKDKKGTALFEDSDARRIYASFFGICPGDCAVAFLSLKEKRIAHAFGFCHKKTFLCTHMAFEQKHSKIAPGKILVFFLMERLCREGFKMFDFSKGDSFFKRQFMDQFPAQYNFYFPKNALAEAWWKIALQTKKFLKRTRDLLNKLN